MVVALREAAADSIARELADLYVSWYYADREPVSAAALTANTA